MMKLVARRLGLSKVGLLALALGFIAVVSRIDYLAGPQMGCSIFHLLPIMLVSWCLGRGYGSSVAFAAAVIWLLDDLMEPPHYTLIWIPFWNAFIRLGFFAITVVLISSLKQQRNLARQDPLTRLANRLAFEEAATFEIERLHRYHHPLTIAYLDCDDFKMINDRFGHKRGDQVLCDLAHALRSRFRANDTVSRLGGDEFAVLMPETDDEAALAAMERIHELWESTTNDLEGTPTLSIGLVTFWIPPHSTDEMLHIADSTMYDAKKLGKNRMKRSVLGYSRIRENV